MAATNNPAGRLLNMLVAFRDAGTNDQSYEVAWANVLGVDADSLEFRLEMTRLAGLPLAVHEAVLAGGSEDQRRTAEYWMPRWLYPILLWDKSAEGKWTPVVDDDSLMGLTTLSALLSATASEGAVPADDDVARIREGIDDALVAVRAATDLPVEFRALLVARLYAVIRAIDTLDLGGPGAVIDASEQLLGAIAVRTQPAQRKDPRVRKAIAAVGAAWALFLSGEHVDNALTGWSHALELVAVDPADPTVPPADLGPPG